MKESVVGSSYFLTNLAIWRNSTSRSEFELSAWWPGSSWEILTAPASRHTKHHIQMVGDFGRTPQKRYVFPPFSVNSSTRSRPPLSGLLDTWSIWQERNVAICHFDERASPGYESKREEVYVNKQSGHVTKPHLSSVTSTIQSIVSF